MKLSHRLATCAIILIFLAACTQGAPSGSGSASTGALSWQEQYDLGIRYLLEGNYEEALIAFTAAIEIDPKQADAYIGLANAYVSMGDIEMAIQMLSDGIESASDIDHIQGLLDSLTQQYKEETQSRFNAYGDLKFEERGNYWPFEGFSTEEQQFIISVTEAATSDNAEALENLLGFTFSTERTEYTIWNDYKISIHASNTEETKDGEYKCSKAIIIEVRPKNGVGCYYHVQTTFIDDVERTSIVPSKMEALTLEKAFCNTEDWQWNGTLTKETSVDQNLLFYRDGHTVVMSTRSQLTGEMIMGVCEGAFVETGHYIETNSEYPDENRDETWETTISIYENGERIGGSDENHAGNFGIRQKDFW